MVNTNKRYRYREVEKIMLFNGFHITNLGKGGHTVFKNDNQETACIPHPGSKKTVNKHVFKRIVKQFDLKEIN